MIHRSKDAFLDVASWVYGTLFAIRWIFSLLFQYRTRRHRIKYADGSFENFPPSENIIDAIATGQKICQIMINDNIVALEMYKADPETGDIGDLVFRTDWEDREGGDDEA